MVETTINDAKDRMEKTVINSQTELSRMRTGRASLSMLDPIKVDYYGAMSPLNQVANISIPEPRLINIQPWDKSMLQAIDRAIQQADIGITPQNDGNIIRLPIPSLTEDRRKELVKVIHSMAEEARVAIRNIRRDALDTLKKAQKDSNISEDEEYNAGIDMQEITDTYIKKIDEVAKAKEIEIMEV
ncbi:ribosome recycling factor [candidate division KSB1 bacterium]|nr:ribosome recycling factor [candidate division KSB1 bacterium]